MREEVCGYVAGLKHGWKDAKKRIKDRLAVEITLHPDEPFSHEFLPYDLSVSGCWWPSTRVFLGMFLFSEHWKLPVCAHHYKTRDILSMS